MTALHKLGNAVLQMLFPRRCPLCGKLLTKEEHAQLCPACTPAFEADLLVRCPVCKRTAESCKCMTGLLSGMSHIGDRQYVVVGFYQPGKADFTCNRLIYTLKDSTDDTAARVLARALSRQLLRLFLKSGEDITGWTITYPPRLRKTVNETGVDQAQRLARFCARDTGASYETFFARRGGKAQKSLSNTARIENAETSIVLKNPEKCRGKRIILCDDILTSGATLSRCAKLLLDAGAEKVFAAAVLKTMPRKQTKTYKSDMRWFRT